ncbi:alpha/beta fold hydrolase [Actimicrobium antarcticum]|uniref:Alpha/beta fold hydrolase n=1 Tax=Actimicrobium antarcticum TaxID=1051899 RepID=A0ABP7SS65_9BURK
MNIINTLSAAFFIAVGAGNVLAHTPAEAPHQTYAEGDFKLESGEVIRDFSLSYVTHGTLNAEKSNAILVVTAIGGNHHRLDYLIGPGKALDPAKYFIISTDAIGNGLTTSPSNSRLQPRMQFPRFTMRDMVQSQYPLVTQKLGIRKLHAVVGASMGGMQALQWAVSYPDAMKAIVPIVPLGRTPAWTTAVLEMLRQSIMADPKWQGGNYAAASPPEQGMRLWAGWLSGVVVRTPSAHKNQFPNHADVIPFLKTVEDGGWKRMDATDWVYQSWAYDMHDVGTTPGVSGGYEGALKAIKVPTLVLAGVGDLLNPEPEAVEISQLIPGAKFYSINPPNVFGHASAAGITAGENTDQNQHITSFLNDLK